MIYDAMNAEEYRVIGKLKKGAQDGTNLSIQLYQEHYLPSDLNKIFIQAEQTFVPYRVLSCSKSSGKAIIKLDGIKKAEKLPGKIFFLSIKQIEKIEKKMTLHKLIGYTLYHKKKIGTVHAIKIDLIQPLLEIKREDKIIPVPYHKKIITTDHILKKIEVDLPLDYFDHF